MQPTSSHQPCAPHDHVLSTPNMDSHTIYAPCLDMTGISGCQGTPAVQLTRASRHACTAKASETILSSNHVGSVHTASNHNGLKSRFANVVHTSPDRAVPVSQPFRDRVASAFHPFLVQSCGMADSARRQFHVESRAIAMSATQGIPLRLR